MNVNSTTATVNRPRSQYMEDMDQAWADSYCWGEEDWHYAPVDSEEFRKGEAEAKARHRADR